MKRTVYIYALFAFFAIEMASCSGDYLDVKPRSNLTVPTTLEDFQQLLDNGPIMHGSTEILEILADDYRFEPDYWQDLGLYDVVVKNSHIWAPDIYGTVESYYYAWDQPYQQVFYANVVLDGLEKLEETDGNSTDYQHIKGSAYFIRAYALYNLAQLYAPAFDEATADTDLGLPLPLSSDVNEETTRKSVRETYGRILADLGEAERLLQSPVDYGRPSRVAARSLMARVYLSMGRYEEAGRYADESLSEYGTLPDYGQSAARDYREAVYLGMLFPGVYVGNYAEGTLIDEALYGSYGAGDLRKTSFFRMNGANRPIKNDNFGLVLYCFSGLDTDEQYLIRAECFARAGNVQLAMDDLNHLLRQMHDNTFSDITEATGEEALEIILRERRKQLIFRGLRWSDLKRLNREGANITLRRTLGDQVYTLEPGSPRWLFPIPPNEISTSGVQQNPR